MTRRFFISLLFLHLRWCNETVFSFIPTHQTRIPILPFSNRRPVKSRSLLHQASQSSSNNAPNDESPLDEMRRMLENAWNQTTMGRIPTTPELAVQECVEALQQAERSKASPNKIYFIELLLPQYDIGSGSRVYDDVLMVEFATLLIQRLQRRAMLTVRDDRVLQSVARVLNARNPTRDVTQVPAGTEKEAIIEFDDFSLIEKSNPPSPIVEGQPIVEFDDFGASPVLEQDVVPAKNDTENSISLPSNSDMDDLSSFRALLLQNWNSTTIEDLDSIRDEERLWDEEEDDDDDGNFKDDSLSNEKEDMNSEEAQYYRLTSLLGSNSISSGADMMDDVVAAVKANALPLEEEEVIVFLSSSTKEEQYAIRALASRYEFQKTMLFINCKLDPLPQELLRGTTVYSILPLIAKPKTSAGTNHDVPPKIVVLRRYPEDWHVHVDRGRGFQPLPTRFSGRIRGPPMEWIQTVVLRYLQQQSKPFT